MKPLFQILFIAGLILPGHLESQTDTLYLSLEEVIALAQSEAPDALVAETRMKSSYWDYRSVLADYKPRITFEGTLPDLNRSINLITLPDGTSAFVQQSQIVNSADLFIRQQVAPTGGTIFARTGLQRLDLLNPEAPNITSYFSTPVSIGFIQPLFAYNTLKWNKKIEPLRYEEAERSYAENMENVAYDASSLFFQLLIAQLNLEAAVRDKANADTLFNISRGRFDVGRIAETELLSIELSAMNADAAVQQAKLDMQSGNERLRNFLGLQQVAFFTLDPPTDIPEFQVDTDAALKYANEFRSEVIEYTRRLVEADAEVAQAKAQSGLQMDVFGQFSLSQSGKELDQAYQDPQDNERLSLGVTVPIFDWGKARARLETAQSNRELEQMIVAQEKVNFRQEIILKVKQFDLLRNQVKLALRAYDVSQKREQMTRNRYYIGKIGITDLNIAIAEKEAARRSYISALQAFWLAYYDLRRITLYDFERNVSLVRQVSVEED